MNNPLMMLTGNITANTNNLDVLNVQNANTLTGNIGANANIFSQVKVAQANDLTILGDIFANTTTIEGNHILTLGNNSVFNGALTTNVNNQGALDFSGRTIYGQIGTLGVVLNALNINGGAGTMVNLQNNIFATNTTVNTGSTLQINGVQNINGNLTINDATLSLAADVTPLTKKIPGDSLLAPIPC